MMVPVALAIVLCAGLASAGCPTNVAWLEFEGSCYWRSTYATTWNDAANACPTVGSGSQLASIHSLLENAFLMQSYNYADSWIGLNDIQTEGTFQWTDGTKVDYTNFYQGEPDNKNNQDCVRFPNQDNPTAAEWDDEHCESDRHFICKMPATA